MSDGRDLQAEVRAFLAARGPSTAPEIALGVRARRADVDALLSGEGFCRVDRPEGAHPHSVYFAASRRVPRPARATARGSVLLGILSDGAWHSRAEILQLAGGSFLTNNAASELRRLGHVVRYERGGYRLVSLAAPDGSSALAPSGAASESAVERAA